MTPEPSGIRKAAILLIALGEQASAALLRQMPEKDAERVTREVARVGVISSEQVESVLEEFYDITGAADQVARGGLDYATKLLTQAFTPETATKLLEEVRQAPDSVKGLEAVRSADPQQLANLLGAEHPQTIALVLSRLKPFQAAAVLTGLPRALRSDVVRRMAGLDRIAPEVIGRIADVIGSQLEACGPSRESYGGVGRVAQMFHSLDEVARVEILQEVERQDAGLVASIRERTAPIAAGGSCR